MPGQWQDELLTRISNPLATVEVLPETVVPVYGPSTAVLTAHALTTNSQIVAAPNLNRRRLILHNDSNGEVYVAFTPSASPALYSFTIAAHATFIGVLGDYTGIVSAVRANGTGTLMVTEVTR